MNTHRIVFVVGAGGSAAFGLPTGAELRSLLSSKLYVPMNERLRELHATPEQSSREITLLNERLTNEARSFQFDFRRSGMTSIDRFLEANSNWTDHGKFAIAKVLVPKQDALLATGAACDSWHSWLLERLLRDITSIQDGAVSFISFNYDRLLYCSMYNMLRFGKKLNLRDTRILMSKISILHPYGYLDIDYDSILENPQSIPTDSTANIVDNYDRVHRASSGISVISEFRDANNSVLSQCKDCLRRATHVVFLGFGFDRLNVERIGVAEINRKAWRHVCVYGMEHSEIEVVKNMVAYNDFVVIGNNDQDCLRFLRARLAYLLEYIKWGVSPHP